MVATSDAVARVRYVSLLTTAAMVAFAANSVLFRAAFGGGEIDAASFSAIRLLSGALALAATERCSGCSGPEGALRHMSIALPTASILTMPVTGRSRPISRSAVRCRISPTRTRSPPPSGRSDSSCWKHEICPRIQDPVFLGTSH